MDLFALEVPAEKFHKNFTSIGRPEDIHLRNYLNGWTEGFVDRDGKLVKEFQTTFNSTFWELYLFNVFKKWQMAVDFSHPYPDFVINAPHKVAVEAVIASNAADGVPEWEREYDNANLPTTEEIVRVATIRLANAIISKYKQFKELYSKNQTQKDRPFVLALSPFEQPFFWEQTQRAIDQVLYGQKRFLYTNDEENNTRRVTGVERIDFITKDNGSEIHLGFFSNNLTPEISAVIFSNVATVGKIRALTKDIDDREMIFSYSRYNKSGLHPIQAVVRKKDYSESLEDGLTIFINPYASIPVTQEFIDLFPGFHAYNVEMKYAFGEAKDGDLLNRMVQVFTLSDKKEKI